MPGSLTSRIKQLGPSPRGFDKNSFAVPKDLEGKPTDSSSSWRDSRTSLSSSTMNTVGTSCVLITTRLNQQESSSENFPSFAPSPPIKRRLTTPDRLYRMMQWGSRTKPRHMRAKLERGRRLLTLTRLACLAALEISVLMQDGARKVNVGHLPVPS